ncbi:MAG: response regulator [Bdellovibrionaceae bacterium]|nr:response regulator [Pseudobdellovibrionaceae bacterium]
MGSEKVRLLIVDDEVDLCHSIASYFEIFGYETLTANGGQEALDLLNNETVQLVITDVRMPKVSGVQLLEAIKAKDVNHPKVLVISGYADLPVEELYNKGADGFFSKPFDSRGMLEAIRKAIVTLDELWKRPPSVEPEFELGFDDKISSGNIGFGRGGFSVAHGNEPWVVDDLIRFHLNLHDPNIPQVRGAGIVRWRKNGQSGGKSISGIEITYLDDACRSEFVKWLEKRPSAPYIPTL